MNLVERYNFFKKYDRVVVTERKETYDAYISFIEFFLPKAFLLFNPCDIPRNGDILNLIMVKKHIKHHGYLAICQNEQTKQVYIIGIEGIASYITGDKLPRIERDYRILTL